MAVRPASEARSLISRLPWATITAVLSLAIAGISLYFQARRDARQISCSMVQADELTRVSSVPDLAAQFVYKGKNVSRLWRLSIDCTNSGDVSLVGRGSQTTLIGDSVGLEFRNTAEILDTTFERNDIGASLVPGQGSLVRLTFDQWKPGEVVRLAVYVSNPQTRERPVPLPRRDIINGDVIITNTLDDSRPRLTWLDRQPMVIRAVVNAITFAAVLLIIVVAIWVAAELFFDFVRFRMWRRRYGQRYTDFVNAKTWSDDLKRSVLKNPQLMDPASWKGFEGEQFSRNPTFDSWRDAILLVFVLAALATVLTVRVVADVIAFWYWL